MIKNYQVNPNISKPLITDLLLTERLKYLYYLFLHHPQQETER